MLPKFFRRCDADAVTFENMLDDYICFWSIPDKFDWLRRESVEGAKAARAAGLFRDPDEATPEYKSYRALWVKLCEREEMDDYENECMGYFFLLYMVCGNIANPRMGELKEVVAQSVEKLDRRLAESPSVSSIASRLRRRLERERDDAKAILAQLPNSKPPEQNTAERSIGRPQSARAPDFSDGDSGVPTGEAEAISGGDLSGPSGENGFVNNRINLSLTGLLAACRSVAAATVLCVLDVITGYYKMPNAPSPTQLFIYWSSGSLLIGAALYYMLRGMAAVFGRTIGGIATTSANLLATLVAGMIVCGDPIVFLINAMMPRNYRISHFKPVNWTLLFVLRGEDPSSKLGWQLIPFGALAVYGAVAVLASTIFHSPSATQLAAQPSVSPANLGSTPQQNASLMGGANQSAAGNGPVQPGALPATDANQPQAIGTNYTCALAPELSTNALSDAQSTSFTLDESRSCVNGRSLYARREDGALYRAMAVPDERRVSILSISPDRTLFERTDYFLSDSAFRSARVRTSGMPKITCAGSDSNEALAAAQALLKQAMPEESTLPSPGRHMVWRCVRN